ncbi:NAD-dependent epimerase/dehydratase family protein [Pedococcus sp. NPDC057267]|uniref:NAD-dependent epimerase/dehydratase family protein n=1 Tax=Pedococcus sp. NPDC057267 TaxID=3346077 RepID=UPI0036307720
MRVAVTGATGLVGTQVVAAAMARGHEVVAVTRDPGPPVPVTGGGTVPRRVAALTDREGLRGAFIGCDAVVHCAAVYAFGSARAAEVGRVNVDGTTSVVRAAADAGLDRVVVTSSSVTRGSSLLPVARTEDDRLGDEPAPAYYASKVAQEEAALAAGREHGIPVVLALPTVVLGGPFTRLAPSNAIVLRYLLDPTRSTFPGGCNVVDARDVGAGHVVLLERGGPGERYLLGGEDVTWRTLHTLVSELAGLPGPFAELPAASAWGIAAVTEWWASLTEQQPLSTRDEASTVGRHYWYSSAKARELGYAARPAREAVAASLAWLAVSRDLPRWAREGLRLHADVRAARELVPAPLGDPAADAAVDAGAGTGAHADGPGGSFPGTGAVRPRPRRSPPAWPRRPR